MTFTDAIIGPDGWSSEDRKPGVFRTACCDCGLVHVHELGIVRLTGKMSEAGKPLVEDVVDHPSLRISHRVRRDDEATDQERRSHRYEYQPIDRCGIVIA